MDLPHYHGVGVGVPAGTVTGAPVTGTDANGTKEVTGA
jgi:hypothetical protein